MIMKYIDLYSQTAFGLFRNFIFIMIFEVAKLDLNYQRTRMPKPLDWIALDGTVYALV